MAKVGVAEGRELERTEFHWCGARDRRLRIRTICSGLRMPLVRRIRRREQWK